MSITKHTPGPWTIEDYGDEEAPVLVIHKDSETRVCFMATPGSRGDPARIEADAHLIIAAPDMLAELKHCVWLLDDMQAEPGLVTKQARAAIAKAEGTS